MKTNIIGQILVSRYVAFIQNKLITHITTNLSPSEIEALYGNRVFSRMRAIFNLIAFDKILQTNDDGFLYKAEYAL